MRKLLIFAFPVIFLIACTTTKNVDNQMQSENGMEPLSGNFVIYRTGEKQMVKHVDHAMYKMGSTIARLSVDGKKIPDTDVETFQNESGYFTWYRFSDKPSNGTWIQRIRIGKINLYIDKRRGGPTAGSNDFYYYEKEKSKYVPITFESFSAALADNPAALEELKKLYPKNKIKSFSIYENAINIPQIVDIYNR